MGNVLKRGFTLAELLVTIGVFAFCSIAVVSILVLDLRLRTLARDLHAVETDADTAIHAVDGLLRAGARVVSTGAIGDRDAVTFDIPTVTPAGTTTADRDRVTVTPNAMTPERIELQVTPATGSRLPAGTRTIARHARAFRIRYDRPTPTDARAVTVTITSAVTTSARTTTATRATVAALRNLP